MPISLLTLFCSDSLGAQTLLYCPLLFHFQPAGFGQKIGSWTTKQATAYFLFLWGRKKLSFNVSCQNKARFAFIILRKHTKLIIWMVGNIAQIALKTESNCLTGYKAYWNFYLFPSLSPLLCQSCHSQVLPGSSERCCTSATQGPTHISWYLREYC